MKNHLVAIIVYDSLCTFEFGCAAEIFALQRPELNIPWYRFAACAINRGKVNALGGITVEATHTLKLLDKANTIIIPGWNNLDESPPELLLKKLRNAYQRGTRICTICSGSFVAAAAGLLDGKMATTHWLYLDKFKKHYPHVKLEPDALYVDEGQIITSAGSAAGLDMLLHIVRKDHGAKIANRIAQRMVISPHREGGQAQFVAKPILSDEKGRLSKLMSWICFNLSLTHSVASLAKKVSMSPRTLQRQFLQSVGMSPYEWLIRQRIAMTKELLESTSFSLQRISELTGFGSVESLRKHFRNYVLLSPIAYRRQFLAEEK